MPKRILGSSEWFPVLTLLNADLVGKPGFEKAHAVEFTETELSDLRRVESEFGEWQRKIAERFGAQSFDQEFDLDEAAT